MCVHCGNFDFEYAYGHQGGNRLCIAFSSISQNGNENHLCEILVPSTTAEMEMHSIDDYQLSFIRRQFSLEAHNCMRG